MTVKMRAITKALVILRHMAEAYNMFVTSLRDSAAVGLFDTKIITTTPIKDTIMLHISILLSVSLSKK
jgi:hypothetical protein